MVFCNKGLVEYVDPDTKSHNPYFNRWFSAINYQTLKNMGEIVTILILIDGFLQSGVIMKEFLTEFKSQSLF